MADLSISSGSGTQTSTQSPQGLVSSGNKTTAGTNVQPGTATTLLTTSTGISLQSTPLTTVSLNAVGAEPITSTKPAPAVINIQPKHHISGGLLGISIGFLVVAAIMVLVITRTAKNTTNYH